jgi:hypothetical protein
VIGQIAERPLAAPHPFIELPALGRHRFWIVLVLVLPKLTTQQIALHHFLPVLKNFLCLCSGIYAQIQHFLHIDVTRQIATLGDIRTTSHVPAQQGVFPIAPPCHQHFGQIAIFVRVRIGFAGFLNQLYLCHILVSARQNFHFLSVPDAHSHVNQTAHFFDSCLMSLDFPILPQHRLDGFPVWFIIVPETCHPVKIRASVGCNQNGTCGIHPAQGR